ncbi:DUF4391 domain-containing protein [Bifidobacterium phasiani]|uniref:DUF4391 domain-containing protein n=1 Tax=Bifidobacterium phasiani TaxID=2834431 RepID=A0ABS6WB14_9BIFI|nr:DUF4391 domain-containing protein [Bifidobacterium phasiani]MBW3083360.1 DUF4391 domain-containing protein [Bifidobacterium phasiani]
MATATSCGSVTAPGLGLPLGVTVPAAKGTLPKQMFVGRAPISSKLRQRFAHDVESIAMMAILRPANTGLAEGRACREILVLGIHVAPGVAVPVEVIDHIAAQRASGILFVCVRDAAASESGEGGGAASAGEGGEQCAFAVRRNVPVRAGHTPVTKVYAGEWKPASQARIALSGATMDELWDSLCAQTILGETDGADVDGRIAAMNRAKALTAEYEKLQAAHARARTTERRNEAYAKMHAIRAELDRLGVSPGRA